MFTQLIVHYLQEFYEMNQEFYQKIEQEFGSFRFGKYEWISLHLRYLLYYMTKYAIQNRECFTAHHYRVSHRLYLLSLFNNMTA